MALDSSPSPSPLDTRRLAEAVADIEIRPLTSLAEFTACVALQKDVWGANFEDVIPTALLQVVSHIGGIIAGAFTADGELIGFVFGLNGSRNGQTIHWSHALGVRESARNAGVGRMLKEHQRAELARRGISTLYWTFDPLMAKNAHLNLNRLGARVIEYVENMYGTTGSPLHHGLATDRLVVSWSTASQPVRHPEASARAAPPEGHPILTPQPRTGDVVARIDAPARPATLWLEVPPDIQRESPATVALWHAATRMHLEWALHDGYAATALYRDPLTSRSFYVLERNAATPA